VVKPGADGPVRHAQNLGDLAQLQSSVVMEDDDRSMIGGQLGESPVELVTQIGVGDRVGPGRVGFGQWNLADPASAGAP
jgi:hypothetical protein